jgi:hypothetical protein
MGKETIQDFHLNIAQDPFNGMDNVQANKALIEYLQDETSSKGTPKILLTLAKYAPNRKFKIGAEELHPVMFAIDPEIVDTVSHDNSTPYLNKIEKLVNEFEIPGLDVTKFQEKLEEVKKQACKQEEYDIFGNIVNPIEIAEKNIVDAVDNLIDIVCDTNFLTKEATTEFQNKTINKFLNVTKDYLELTELRVPENFIEDNENKLKKAFEEDLSIKILKLIKNIVPIQALKDRIEAKIIGLRTTKVENIINPINTQILSPKKNSRDLGI